MKAGKKQEMEMNQAEVQKKEEAVTENGQKGKNQKKRNRKEKKRTGKKRKKAPFVAAGILVAVIVFRLVAGGGSGAGTVVETTQAFRGDLQESIRTSGSVLSEKKKVIFAPVSGTLGEVYVAAGDVVSAGETIISYDMEKLENSFRESRLQQDKSTAVYDAGQAEDKNNQWKLYEATHNLEILNQQITDTRAYIKKLQEELNKNKRDTNNAFATESMDLNNSLQDLQKQLSALTPGTEEYANKEKEIQDVNKALSYNSYASSAATNSDYVMEMQQKIEDAQDKLTEYEKYKSEMEAQKTSSQGAVWNDYDKKQKNADKELADLSYETAQKDYNLATEGISADFDGVITECSAIAGEGVTSGTKLLTLESTQLLKVSFQASKSDIEKLAVGQNADVVISGKTYPGEIRKINRMAQKNDSGSPMVGVEVHLTEVDDNIILGMDAKVTVYTKKAENTLLIPVEVINADRDGDFLYAAENGVVVKKQIVCGISTDTYTEVLEGITEEDQIITGSYAGNLEEGMAVTVLAQ